MFVGATRHACHNRATEADLSPDIANLILQAHGAREAGRFGEAEALYRQAVVADPANPQARHDLGAFLKLVGRSAEAEPELREAVRLAPGDPRARHALGIVLLTLGRWAEGWPLYEAGHEIPELNRPTPDLPFPEWRGEDCRRLLVFGEQGFGDQIMSARFAGELAARGVDVTLLCSPPLVRLFAPLGCRTIGQSGAVDFPDPDAWAMSGDLPGRWGARPDRLPGAPYLRGDAATAAGGIGVVARGNPRHMNDANRSLPAEAAERLMQLPGAISLHVEDTGATDFQATADRIAGLDLVISVDTAIAHLAGAMGKPAFILLPFLMTDWRWGEAGETTPWYPTARLFRQPAPGDWAAVVDQVTAALAR